MATMQQGWTPDKTALGLMAYAAFQELATRISHWRLLTPAPRQGHLTAKP